MQWLVPTCRVEHSLPIVHQYNSCLSNVDIHMTKPYVIRVDNGYYNFEHPGQYHECKVDSHITRVANRMVEIIKVHISGLQICLK